ncbi:cation:proton antiporter [Lactococcus formosensis]|jgi:Kef-type K+ transport system membrane component KefB|uniref:Cation:proton antiporter n=1 Tax=Lactococcus formosensis TaxID=1281486 RepID=A0A9X4NYJ4_9LACT|nr:cation:proton antiporter [Lactococcus formosensis]MCH1723940.1 cation:proton antiporter [Lactococcus formosensis]MCO7180981.1 cation:proton antiporter [Lactococcus formosensis]MDG6112183.1 cation:proton antiporter [Lactococcus formosensis]MDG6114221.1 cation:proton antiporter [Lactococcus formosensis]MDG6116098.1 cation:proton antiporter [Lactococcus formosensis]
MNDIFQLTLILVASLVATLIARRIRIPAVVGQILIGIVLAPAALGWLQGGHTIEVLSEIGVILLMFLAGLESDLGVLKKNFKPALLVALAGVIVPLLVFWGVTTMMGYAFSTAIFYGIVFAATSVSITVEVLQEYGKLSTKAGSIILGAAVVDDILAVLALSIFTSTQSSSGNLPKQFFMEFLFLLFLVLVHKSIPKVWRFVEKLPVYAKNTTAALILCLVLSLLADAAGMSAVIGSFFAGLALSQTDVSHKIEEYSSAIAYVVFIPVFFVSIAISVTFESIFEHPILILFFTLLAVLTKFVPAYFIGKSTGLTTSDSALVGTGMVSRGEMALIIAQIGLASQVINSDIYSELVIVIILSTLIAPFLIKLSLKKD